jgi:NADP-dependent 3-hydroxy-3-methylglutaryl-CoA reductase
MSPERKMHDLADRRSDSPPKLPGRGQYTEHARQERLEFLQQHTGVPLRTLQPLSLQPEALLHNVENLIGAVDVPVGVAGPLLFRGQQAQGTLFLPMATTEGALVASICRGANALSRSGGVVTRVLAQQMVRSPFFEFDGLEDAWRFCRMLDDCLPALRAQVRRVSNHAHLLRVETQVLGRCVYTRFLYETADAAGQNMTTSCTWFACQWLLERLEQTGPRPRLFAVDGNASGDKKVCFQSFQAGRGTRVVAESLLTRECIAQVLKTTPEALFDGYQLSLAAAVQTGMLGHNVNVANVVAGVFIATGQDVACVHESSVAQLLMRPEPEGLYVSMMLPGLVVGTVGGGTHLPRQRALLEMMGCAGEGGTPRLAELIAGFALALDLSTLSAIMSGQFAAAHERLGRNRPVRFFSREDLTEDFLRPALERAVPGAELLALEPLGEVSSGAGLLTELTSRRLGRSKQIGHQPLRLRYRTAGGERGSLDLMLKLKPLDEEVLLAAGTVAALGGESLARAWNHFGRRVGFAGTHLRELALAELPDERLRRHSPAVYLAHRDDKREAYVLAMELLRDVELLDSADDPSGWGPAQLEAALRGIAQVHAIWHGREEELLAQSWLGYCWTAGGMVEAHELWEALLRLAVDELPEWFPPEELALHERLLDTLPEWWRQLEAQPRTLVHNDFNPRNIALRRTGEGLRLCAYDWELATARAPQHDLAELLSFVLTPQATRSQVGHLVELHRQALQEATGTPLDARSWRAGYALCLQDLLLHRMGLYLQSHIHRPQPFTERVLRTLRHLIHLERGER